jgi:hypothetical protein
MYPAYEQDLGTYTTNASGILSLSGPYNWFYISTNYGHESYSVNATVNAGVLTCVTLSIPTGRQNMTRPCDPADYLAS